MGRKARDKKDRPRLETTSETSNAAPSTSATGEARESVAAARPAARRAAQARVPLLPPRAALWGLALMALTGAVYLSGLDTPFLLDDPINIEKNEALRRPLGLFGLLGDPRAVVTMSLRWNWMSGGLDVTGYHLLNVFAHAATGWLVFVLAWATLQQPVFAGRHARDGEALAAVVAAIFLTHPIQTESVTYVIQRAEIFVAAGLVGALLAFVSMREGPSRTGMAALVTSSLFGMYSKPSFAVLPALFLAYDLFFLGRGDLRTLARRWPAYAVASVFAIATFALSSRVGSLGGDTAGFEIEGIAPLDYLQAQFGVLVHYLRVTLWPTDLCFDCGYRGPWPVLASPLGDSVALPAAILVAIAAASMLAATRRPEIPFAVFGSAIVLAPTSTIVPLTDFYVEHRLYLPIAFVALALVPSASAALSSLFASAGLDAGAAAKARVAAAALVCTVLAALTISRNELLADPVALMEDSLARAPQNERVHYNLANAYKRQGRLEEAIPHYQEAIRLIPNVVRSYMNLGSLYLEQDKVEDALAVFRAGAEAKPEAAMAHRNVASAALRLSRWEEALEAAEKSLALEPKNANGLRHRAFALDRLGRKEEAREAMRAALEANPRDGDLQARLKALGG